jgi:hypothetical protein
MPELEFPATPRSPLGWFRALERYLPEHYTRSDPECRHPRPWQDPFDPQKNSVYSHNEMEVEAPASVVFHALTEVHAWHGFYPNASDVVVIGSDEPARLRPDVRFEWTTFSTRQKSKVTLFEPGIALGWTAESPGTHAYHRWILESKKEMTRVITEECQHGPVAFLDRYWMNRSLHAAHHLWLEGLRAHVLAQRRTV